MSGRHRGRRWHSSVVVGLVAALAGLMFATSASVFRDEADRSPSNLVELARAETARLEQIEASVTELRQRRDELVEEQQDQQSRPARETEKSDLISHAAAQAAVTGPGLIVELWDAPVPADMAASGLHPDVLVVHQQDLEAVMNAMWAGGAEAMMIQDQRISSTSSVRCVGNVLLLHGRHYSPPYTISAIGDPETLEAAVEASDGVQVYRQYVEAVGLGFSMTRSDEIAMPAYTGPTRLDYATPWSTTL